MCERIAVDDAEIGRVAGVQASTATSDSIPVCVCRCAAQAARHGRRIERIARRQQMATSLAHGRRKLAASFDGGQLLITISVHVVKIDDSFVDFARSGDGALVARAVRCGAEYGRVAGERRVGELCQRLAAVTDGRTADPTAACDAIRIASFSQNFVNILRVVVGGLSCGDFARNQRISQVRWRLLLCLLQWLRLAGVGGSVTAAAISVSIFVSSHCVQITSFLFLFPLFKLFFSLSRARSLSHTHFFPSDSSY